MDNDQLIAELANKAKPVKPVLHPFALLMIWLGISIIYISQVLVWQGVRSDIMQQFQSWLFMSEIIALLLLILSCALSATLLSYPDMYQKKMLTRLPIIGIALFIGIIIWKWMQMAPNLPYPAHNMGCTLHITFLALPPALLAFFVLGKMASTHSKEAGCVSLLTAFGIGALILRLYEPTDNIIHIATWHYLPMLAVGFLGVILGRQLLKW